MARSAAEVEAEKKSRSAARVTRSRNSGAMRSLSDSSSWAVVSWQYSAVLRTRQAVCSSDVLGRPSPDERRSTLQSGDRRQITCWAGDVFRYDSLEQCPAQYFLRKHLEPFAVDPAQVHQRLPV